MKKLIIISIFISSFVVGQISSFIPAERVVDWTKAGLKEQIPPIENVINIGPNDSQGLIDAIDNLDGTEMTLIQLSSGMYSLSQSITLKSNTILKGVSTGTATELEFTHNYKSAIFVNPENLNSIIDSTDIVNISALTKGSSIVAVSDASNLSVGDYIHLIFNSDEHHFHNPQAAAISTYDSGLDFIGQMNQIKAINGNSIEMEDELRFDYSGLDSGRVRFIGSETVKNVGIEDLKITGNDCSWLFWFDWATNCWIRGVDSDTPECSHIKCAHSSNIEITGCHIHHAANYDGRGAAYGVHLLHQTTNVLVENNIFWHLRHAMELSHGTNGNVFGYNYSFDQYSEDNNGNENFLGDVSLHGHFPFANLFEGNVFEFAFIDVWWGYAGPDNTFYRNRSKRRYGNPNTIGEGFIIQWLSTLSNVNGVVDSMDYEFAQNIAGTRCDFNNDNTTAFYIEHNSGLDFIHNNKNCNGFGNDCSDYEDVLSGSLGNSYYYESQPFFATIWPFDPNNYQSLPAYARYQSGNLTYNRNRYIDLINKSLDNDENLGGLLSLSVDNSIIEYNQILSGNKVQIPNRGITVNVQTHNDTLQGQKHLKWGNSVENYLMKINDYNIPENWQSIEAVYNYQSPVIITSNIPNNTQLQIHDPWYVEKTGANAGEQLDRFHYLIEDPDFTGTYKVFLNQGDPSNPQSTAPYYSLRVPAFTDNGNQTYSIFDKWVARDEAGEELLPYEIFNGGENSLETPVVFTADVASVEAECIEVTIIGDEVELIFENGNYLLEAPALYATTETIYKFIRWIGTGAEFEDTTSNQTVVNFTEPNAEVVASFLPTIFNYHGLTINSELIIPAGANYEMNFGFEFRIREGGHLTLAGTAENPVELVAQSSDSVWSGIDVQSQDYNTLSINHTVISGADTAVNFHENAVVDMHALTNITFVNNEVAVKIEDSYMDIPSIVNCIFDNNEVGLDLDLNECTWVVGRPIEWLTIHHCLFYNNSEDIDDHNQTGYYVTDNLIMGQNPLFVDIANDDYHLQSGSPCIDSGDPDSPDDPDGTIADIGAFFYLQNGNYVENNANWNIVGLPREIDEDDSHYLDIFPGSIEGTCSGYDGGYVNVDNLTVGEGYWLRFYEEGTTIIVGAEIPVLNIDMSEGWNMISGLSQETPLVNIDDPNQILVENCFFGFENGFIPAESMIPGKGYWVRANGTGTITITNEAQTSGGFVNLMEDANYIKFTNATGKEKEVYFGVDVPEEDQLSYTLPPLPPDEVMQENFLDARYTNNYTYTEATGTIEVRNTDYPLTVEYGILNDNGEWEISSNAPKRRNGDEEYGDIGRVKLNRTGKIVVEHPIESFTIRKTSVNNLPTEFALSQNYPNPFNPITTIMYDVPKESHVTLTVYDLMGRVVKELVSGKINAGTHSIIWNGTDAHGKAVSSGMYLDQLKTDTFMKTKKLVLLK